MKPFFSLIPVLVLFMAGCAPLTKQSVEFRTGTYISISINNDQFDAVELQPSETLLWQDSKLIGIITAIDTAPQFQTAMEEVKQGFEENIKSSETTRELDLPDGIFGFASSMRGFTTAFIATKGEEASWTTISVRDGYFDGILSSISAE